MATMDRRQNILPLRFCKTVSKPDCGRQTGCPAYQRPFDQKTGKFKTGIPVEEIRRVTHFLDQNGNGPRLAYRYCRSSRRYEPQCRQRFVENAGRASRTGALFILISHSFGTLAPTIRVALPEHWFRRLTIRRLRTPCLMSSWCRNGVR